MKTQKIQNIYNIVDLFFLLIIAIGRIAILQH